MTDPSKQFYDTDTKTLITGIQIAKGSNTPQVVIALRDGVLTEQTADDYKDYRELIVPPMQHAEGEVVDLFINKDLTSDFVTEAQSIGVDSVVGMIITWAGAAGTDVDTKVSLEVNNVQDEMDGGWNIITPDAFLAVTDGTASDGFEGGIRFSFWRLRYTKGAGMTGGTVSCKVHIVDSGGSVGMRVLSKAAFSSAPGSGAIAWSATGIQGENIAIVEDIETLISIINMPFDGYNSDGIIFDPANNWIDVSAIDNNAWITIVVSYLGISGDADITPSFRIINDRNAIGTYFAAHGQTSKLKNGKKTSYSCEAFNGGADVLQVYVETDKNETLTIEGIRIKIDLP